MVAVHVPRDVLLLLRPAFLMGAKETAAGGKSLRILTRFRRGAQGLGRGRDEDEPRREVQAVDLLRLRLRCPRGWRRHPAQRAFLAALASSTAFLLFCLRVKRSCARARVCAVWWPFVCRRWCCVGSLGVRAACACVCGHGVLVWCVDRHLRLQCWPYRRI